MKHNSTETWLAAIILRTNSCEIQEVDPGIQKHLHANESWGTIFT